mmetsp:Transcript_76053/g.150701  ORF Transcript_76053/g.150701 Transcript_76053/m.150701 type:complete len:172 (-) Transcript_76053:219-734(-)
MADVATEPTRPPTAEPPSAVSQPVDEEAAKAAKRKEIEAKLAALKLAKEKEAEQKSSFFGEHPGITCDGCGVAPMVGYRYKCKDCANHDICENCYDDFKSGKVSNGLGKQVISTKAEDHRFFLHKDKSFTPLVKKAAGAAKPVAAKVKPNEPCTCGSGKKYKKCCGAGSGQ